MNRILSTVGLLMAAMILAAGCAPTAASRKHAGAAAGDCCEECNLAAKPGAVTTAATKAGAPAPAAAADEAAENAKWTVLFDGKSLDGWASTLFGGNDDPTIENGEMIIPAGATLGGVNYTKPTPVMNYEVEVVGRRRSGTDFWCGLTVPVGEKQFVSLILGGWGGTLCGISSIDGNDASENNTTSYQKFENNKWYTARLRVTPTRLQAWLDGKPIVDEDTTDKRLSIRIEVSKSKPFGIATWMTEAGFKSVRVRELSPTEVETAAAKATTTDKKD
jgi:hypothetical protein